MKKDLLMWDETLFRDPEVFEFDYVPGQFQFRENQMRELAFQIRPGMRGGRPLNSICKGLPGTGKTTSVRKLFSEIGETTKKLFRYMSTARSTIQSLRSSPKFTGD